MKNIVYYPVLNRIGGIESFIYYMSKKYQDNDITVYYGTGYPEQIQRLKQFVRVKQYKGEKIVCEKAIFNYRTDIIDNVEAKEYIQVIHCDFKEATKIGYPPNINPKVTRYVACCQNAANIFEELTGIKPEVSYNPIMLDKPKKVLNLISATRLSGEKGKNRMIKLADMLDAAGIPYIWTIYTNDTNAIRNPNIIYRAPRYDVVDYIANADYLVQLSDTEGYPYSILESLSVGTPVIVTPLPVLKEMGANETNSIVIDFDMRNVPLEKIYQGLPAFEYKANKDRWGTIMAKGKSTYKKERTELCMVKPKKKYFDLQMNRIVEASEAPFQVTKERAETLVDLGVVSVVAEGDSGVK